MVAPVKPITVEDFWDFTQLAENKGKRFDLIEGVIIEMAPAGEEHGDIASELNLLVRQHVKAKDAGRVTAAETGYVLYKNHDPNGKDTVLAPDVGFTSWDTANRRASHKFAPNSPDLAIEVVSPGDRAADIQERVEKYLKYGTRLVWVVYPRTKSVVVHAPDGSVTLQRGDKLDGGDVLPGFEVKVQDVFP